MTKSRREILASGVGVGFAAALGGVSRGSASAQLVPARSSGRPGRPEDDELFRISLAQWSLHRTLRAGELDPLDFPGFARETCDIEAVEYVNQFFADRAGDFEWLGQLRRRAEEAGVRSLLVMIDGEGALADPDEENRRRAVANHFKWIAAAGFLGCHSIRVNAAGSGGWDEQRARAADSLRRLGDVAEPYGIDVIVENHGGLSSNGKWLAEVMVAADHPRVGTLPDFGNFRLENGEEYDRYQGVRELMPFARAVSAKAHAFDGEGNEVRTDYERMLRIVVAAGYRGYVGVEWEGSEPGEVAGIQATKRLLERVRAEIAAEAGDGR